MNSVFKTLLFQPESIPSCKNAFVRAMLYCVSYLSGTFTTVLRERTHFYALRAQNCSTQPF